MTVRQVIEELMKLEQDKNIWVCYDTFEYFAPVPDKRADTETSLWRKDQGVNEGDYIITAG